MTRLAPFAALLLLAACGRDAGIEAPDGGTLDTEPSARAGDAASVAEAPALLEVAANDGRFTVLLAALEASGLDEDLAGDGPFTVFAPTDAAFEALGEEGMAAFLDPANRGQLRTLLRYHVAAGEAQSAELAGEDIRTLTGSAITLSRSGERLVVGEDAAVVTDADIEAQNGVIHVIDSVLIPPSDVL